MRTCPKGTQCDTAFAWNYRRGHGKFSDHPVSPGTMASLSILSETLAFVGVSRPTPQFPARRSMKGPLSCHRPVSSMVTSLDQEEGVSGMLAPRLPRLSVALAGPPIMCAHLKRVSVTARQGRAGRAQAAKESSQRPQRPGVAQPEALGHLVTC